MTKIETSLAKSMTEVIAKAKKAIHGTEHLAGQGFYKNNDDNSTALEAQRIIDSTRLIVDRENLSRSFMSVALEEEETLPSSVSKVCHGFAKVVEKTIRYHSDWSERHLQTAAPHLESYAGLPVNFDILELMGVHRNEAVFCRLLAWLLDPDGSHGVGDSFLRLFIARLGISCRGRILDYSRPVNAVVESEISWDVPASEAFQGLSEVGGVHEKNNARKLRVDILVWIQGYVLPIEVKVYAGESEYLFRGERWQQAALYGRMWQLMLDARRDLVSKLSSSEGSALGEWNVTLTHCIESNRSLKDRVRYLDGGRATVVPVLIHPRRNCVNHNQVIGQRSGEHGLLVRHLRWLDIDRMLYRLTVERDIQAGRLDLIRSFRTTILRLATGNDLVTKIEDLRLRIAEPALTRRFPLESAKTLQIAMSQFQQIDVCCQHLEQDIEKEKS